MRTKKRKLSPTPRVHSNRDSAKGWSERLGGWVTNLTYDFRLRLGELHSDNRCAMNKVTELFGALDPNVRTIHTFIGGGRSVITIYHRDAEGWKVLIPSESTGVATSCTGVVNNGEPLKESKQW